MTTTTPATSTAVGTTPADLFSHLSEADAHLTYEQLRRETPVRRIDRPPADRDRQAALCRMRLSSRQSPPRTTSPGPALLPQNDAECPPASVTSTVMM
jgi:hypothetical protein